MHVAEDSIVLSLVLRVVHAVVYLALGGAYGYWTARRTERGSAALPATIENESQPQLPPLNPRTAETLFSKLYGLRGDMAQGVDEHSSTVAAVSKELTALVGEDNSSAPIVQAIASLLEANARLEKHLATASEKMQEQA